MAKSLLDRQTSLVEFVTSGAAIYGKADDMPVAADLQGIDRALLRVEAHFSHAKRMQKIVAVLPKTFALLGSRKERIIHAFAQRCPPATINRLENARQFFQFLSVGWEESAPPYITDVAACEIAFAVVDNDGGLVEARPRQEVSKGWRGAIRRSPAAQLLRCTYDLRAFFETEVASAREQAEPIPRDIWLAIAIPPSASRPQVFEVVPPIFDLLAALDAWVDPPDRADFLAVLANLARSGLIEVHP